MRLKWIKYIIYIGIILLISNSLLAQTRRGKPSVDLSNVTPANLPGIIISSADCPTESCSSLNVMCLQTDGRWYFSSGLAPCVWTSPISEPLIPIRSDCNTGYLAGKTATATNSFICASPADNTIYFLDPDQNVEALGCGYVAGDTVVAETSYGLSSTEGVSAEYSRKDHTHGTPSASKGVVIESPADADRLLLVRADTAWTVTGINCIVDPADSSESVVIALYESDGSGDFTNLATNGLDGATTITCDNDGAADDGTLSNPSIDAGDWVGIDIGAVSGTVSTLTVTFTY